MQMFGNTGATGLLPWTHFPKEKDVKKDNSSIDSFTLG